MSEDRVGDLIIKSAAQVFFERYSPPFKHVRVQNRWYVCDVNGKVVTQIWFGKDGEFPNYPTGEEEIADMLTRGLNVLSQMPRL